jgi:cyclase
MLMKRIIPCLDILDGRVVKGRRFENLIDAGDPVALAARYSSEGADELVMLDISASLEGRRPFFEIVRNVAREVAIPLTIGGGIRSIADIIELLWCGADKVTLNTVLVEKPELLSEAAKRVGSQALVASIDATRLMEGWAVRVKSGTEQTRLDAVRWAGRLVACGAGELLITSIDRDGMKTGYDCELLRAISDTVRVPVVASGGAGTKEHILEALEVGNADAVLAASIFHFDEISIRNLKLFLESRNIPVRL